MSNIVRDVIDSLRRLRLSAGVAVAPTPGAAWALASFGENGTIVPRRRSRDRTLIRSPSRLCGSTTTIRESLHHLGLETIGQVMNLPRSALPARFGPTLLLRLDQALGRDRRAARAAAVARADRSADGFRRRRRFAGAIWLVFKQLIGRVIVGPAPPRLRGAAGRGRILTAPTSRSSATRSRLSRPSRDPSNLFNLIRCATENVDDGDDGFLGIRLHVPLAERLDDEQIALLGGERYAGEIELAQLIERLRVRLGEDAIAQPKLVESHVPETCASRGMGFQPVQICKADMG